MNGEEKNRLTILETLFKERWDNHDKRSEEKWDFIAKQLRKLDKLQCDIHHERMKGINGRVTLIWSMLVLITTVFGIAIKFMK